ncbi:MAG: glycosyltransferase [Bacteroidales bacterium]|nr:glycosyltransferase [Bacteroidales bacterium]
MEIAIIISILIFFLYSATIIVFAFSFFLHKPNNFPTTQTKFVSVIIACRNEEKNLPKLLESLKNQDYQGGHEIIIVNDHSSDKSTEIINDLYFDGLYLFELPRNLSGKKDALRFGAKNAKGDILLFTDADCIVPKNWITIMSTQLTAQNSDMLCGPVEFKKTKSFLNGLFRLEFMSLTGSGAAGFFINKPFMCNGANFSIRKDIYLKNMDLIRDDFSSGDDVFLLHQISKTGKAKFLLQSDAIVKTNSPQSLKDFFSQRIRWASKTTGYRDSFSIFISVTTFAMSFILITLLAIAIVSSNFWTLFFIGLGSKTIADICFLIPVTKFYRDQKLLLITPVLQIFYPIYIILTATISLFYKPYWKGRKIK